jgi:isohexenylglutaconyl-CoA hydratase
VDALVGNADFESVIGQTVSEMHRAAPGALASTKHLLQRLRGKQPDLRDEAAIAFAAALRSPEAAQGLASFARKQPAPWVRKDGAQ